MRRWLRQTLLFLLIGAVINVAVAWACALNRARDFEKWIPKEQAALMGWPAEVPESWPPPTSWSERRSFGFTGVWVVNAVEHPTSASTMVETIDTEVELETAGWPCRCLRSTRPFPSEDDYNHQNLGLGFTFISWKGGILKTTLIPPASSRSHYLPLEPLWPGFAVDAALYGALVWLALGGAIAIRRAVRTRAGLCARCAYPVGGLAACPECGHSRPHPHSDPIAQRAGGAARLVNRRALHLTLFLLLGAVINIAIAWTGAVVAPSPIPDSAPGWVLTPPPEWVVIDPKVPPSSSVSDSHILTVKHAGGWIRNDGIVGRGLQYEVGAGWPWRSFQRSLVRFEPSTADAMDLSLTSPESLREGLHVPFLDGCGPRPGCSFVPVTPRWPGFAANSLLFAGVCWFLVWSVGCNVRWTWARALGVVALGACATFLVSTAGVVWFPPRSGSFDSFSTDPEGVCGPPDLLALLPDSWRPPVARTSGRYERAESLLCTMNWVEDGGIPVEDAINIPDELVTVSAGWPLRSFVATGEGTLWKSGYARLRTLLAVQAAGRATTPVPANTWQYGVETPDFLHPSAADPLGLGPSNRVIPLRPIALGLIVDTLFFAILAGALVGTALGGRRALRLRRGLCPHCAYPVGSSPVCSECGKPVKPRAGGTS